LVHFVACNAGVVLGERVIIPLPVGGWGEGNIAKRVGVRQKNCGAWRGPLLPPPSL